MAVSTAERPKRRMSETLKNYWLDAALLLAFIIDMNTRFTGIPVHEWLGAAFGIGLIYHMMLHWKWITSVSKRLFGKLPTLQRVRYVINLALFIMMVVVVITGFWISESLMGTLGLPTTDNHFFEELHHVSAELVPMLVAVHLALDWKWIVTNTKKYVLRQRRK